MSARITHTPTIPPVTPLFLGSRVLTPKGEGTIVGISHMTPRHYDVRLDTGEQIKNVTESYGLRPLAALPLFEVTTRGTGSTA